MGLPRAWLMGEIETAARALLVVERAAARSRRGARWICQSDISIPATEAVGRRFGKGRHWLEAVIEVYDAARADPERFGPAVGFLERRGAPLVARRWVRENSARSADAMTALAFEGTCAPIVTEQWPLSVVNVAARALLADAGGGDAPRRRDADPFGGRKALTVIARLWGEQADWLRKILEVCEAAEADPVQFGSLVAVMDKSGRPAAAHSSLRSRLDEERVANLRPLLDRFSTLVIDPPWNEDNLSPSAGHDYAQMSFEAIRSLPIGQWAEDDCHLWLWATNNTLPLAFALVESWGFTHKAFHTWVKETDDGRAKIGLGREFRNSTEHVLFARRGSRDTLLRRKASLSTPTHHRWPVGVNSEKPEGFYDLVRACSYPRYGEAFQRLARPDFTNLYVPAEPLAMVAAE